MNEAIENISQIHFTSSKLSTRDCIPVAHYSKHLYSFDSSKFLSKLIPCLISCSVVIFDRISGIQHKPATAASLQYLSALHSTALPQTMYLSASLHSIFSIAATFWLSKKLCYEAQGLRRPSCLRLRCLLKTPATGDNQRSSSSWTKAALFYKYS